MRVVYLDSVSLSHNVVGDGSGNTEAVEAPVAGIEVVSGRGHGATRAAKGVADLSSRGEAKVTVPLAHCL